jgi:8-oxo-dGTP diphosphatase
MNSYNHPRPAVTVDIAVFRQIQDQYQVLLVKRSQPPFKDFWALPGGFVEMRESLEQSAARELEEETGMVDLLLKQVYTYGEPDRDPRGRVISVSFSAVLERAETKIRPGSDAKEVRWFNMNSLPDLAFDHGRIITNAFKTVSTASKFPPA